MIQIIYLEGCGYSKRALELLEHHKLKYNKITITQEKKYEAKKKIPN